MENTRRQMVRPVGAVSSPADIDKKWKPVTKGLTPREAVYTAFVMEREVLVLRERSPEGVIPGLKYVFPIIRKATPFLIDRDLTENLVRDTFREAASSVLAAADSIRHGAVAEAPSPAEIAEFIDPVAIRAKASIEDLRSQL